MSQDPLSRLITQWQPKNSSKITFTDEVMKRIELEVIPTYPKSFFEVFVEKWLPPPQILLPMAATIVLMINAGNWKRMDAQVKRWAALQWHQSLSNPTSSITLNGAVQMENPYAK